MIEKKKKGVKIWRNKKSADRDARFIVHILFFIFKSCIFTIISILISSNKAIEGIDWKEEEKVKIYIIKEEEEVAWNKCSVHFSYFSPLSLNVVFLL